MSKAFTLIELLLVLVIMGVLLSLNLPSINKAYSRTEVRQAADKIVYLLRYGQSRAIVEGCVFKMGFDNSSVQLMRAGNDSGNSNFFAPVSGRMGRVLSLPDGVHFRDAPVAVLFSPEGQIDPVRFVVAGQKDEFIVSTREIPGHVLLLQEDQIP